MTQPHDPSQPMTRRQVLERTAFAAGVAAAVAASERMGSTARAAEPAKLSKDDVVLFQGDSITDAGRNRGAEGNANNPSGLGSSYAHYISAGLLGAHPVLQLRCYNRGISGHKVPDLAARWQKDTIDLKPALLSILIGVNDIWHKLNGKYDGTVESYRDGYKALLADTKEKLPGVTLVICEPFVLRCGAVNDKWFPEFDERRAAAKEVADGAGAIWVPFQSMFDQAVEAGTQPNYWAGDGVHPTMAGHALMAATWRKVTGL